MESCLYESVFKRKSFHFFRGVGDEKLTKEELSDIKKAYEGFAPLFPDIKTEIRIVPGSDTNCRRGEEYCILLYSEKKDGYLQNIGYLGEKLDLYLVSKNIGSLWYGIGRTDEKELEDMTFVIMIAIRKVNDVSLFRKDMTKSKRKSVSEFWEGEEIPGVTEIVRFAPSACNIQPWLVKNGEKLSVYRYKKPGVRGIIPIPKISYYNRIDIGIFICFLEICLDHEGVNFERELFSDEGGDRIQTLVAEYILR